MLVNIGFRLDNESISQYHP